MNVVSLQLPDPVVVVIDGVSIATYELFPDGPLTSGDIVMCHGTPWSSEVWASAARHLTTLGYRVLMWDMPGYGRSVMDATVPVDLASQMSRLTSLLAHWELERPHVVAHDVGGAVALGAHLLNGRDFAGLFLWDAVALDPWGSAFFRLVADRSAVFAALPSNLHAALVREYVAGAALHRLPDYVVDLLIRPWQGARGQPAFYRQIAELSDEHTRSVVERLHQVRCPVSIGWGEQDPWIPVEQAARLRALLPETPPPLILLDIGHLAPLEAPLEVQRTLERWLDTGTGRAPGAGVSDELAC